MLTARLIQNFKQKKGFTLVELMVAITIIAILSVVGVTVYTGVQKSARDAKRRADIDAIATALETNKTTNSSSYNEIATTQFASGQLPYDPKASRPGAAENTGCGGAGDYYTQRCWYCFYRQEHNRGVGYQGYCDQGAHYVGTQPLAGSTYWTVCANLESGNPAYYCKSSAQ